MTSPKISAQISTKISAEISTKIRTKIFANIGLINLLQAPVNITNQNNNENTDQTQNLDTSSEKKDEDNGSSHEVIHKKDGRLHIYIRQDKYKGELKSKNWVGRLYHDGKQKISSSGTPNLEEAIPILEKWFDDVVAGKEKEKEKEKEIQEQPVKTEETSVQPETSTQIVNEEQIYCS